MWNISFSWGSVSWNLGGSLTHELTSQTIYEIYSLSSLYIENVLYHTKEYLNEFRSIRLMFYVQSTHTHTHTQYWWNSFLISFQRLRWKVLSVHALNNCLIKKKVKDLLINNNAFMFLLAVVLESVKKWMTTPGSNLCKTTLPHWHNVPLNRRFDFLFLRHPLVIIYIFLNLNILLFL